MDKFNKEFQKIMEGRNIALSISADEIKPVCRSLYEVAYSSKLIQDGDEIFICCDTADKELKKSFEKVFIDLTEEKNITDKKDKQKLFDIVNELYIYTATHQETLEKSYFMPNKNRYKTDSYFRIIGQLGDLNRVDKDYLEEIKQDIIK